MFVSTLLERAAVRWPERVAVVDGDVRLTYSQLRDRVHRLANALIGLGLEPGARVIDLQKNAHTYVESDLACAIAGVVRVPVNVRLTAGEWSYIAENSGAHGIIYGPEFAEQVGDLLDRRQMPACVSVGGQGPGWDLERLLGESSPTAPRRFPQPDDIVSLNYSSGTTGKPKGCIRTAANRHVSLQDMLLGLFEGELGPGDVFLHAGPITHASGLFVLPHIAVGATQMLMRSFDAEEVRRLLEREPITGTVLVPTMLERVLATLDGEPARFPELKRLAYAGAPMAPDRIGAAYEQLGGRLVQFYGLVEAIPPLSVLTPADHAREELRRSAGRPALGVAMEILDEEGRPADAGATGELVIGGEHVMAGYWADDEATVKTVDAGWLRTGDIAWRDEEGYIYLVDRKADMIITGGFNVMPREIELVLAELDEVAEAAVVGLPDPTWGEAVTAFVVAAPGAQIDPDRLVEHCAGRLSAFKKPKRVEIVEELPKASTGKISRSALRVSAVAGGSDG